MKRKPGPRHAPVPKVRFGRLRRVPAAPRVALGSPPPPPVEAASSPAELLSATREDLLDRIRRLEDELHLRDLQNEHLRDMQAEIEETLQRYADVYDLSPIGYLTFDRHGVIRDANLTAAELLNSAHDALIGRSLEILMPVADRPAIRDFLRSCRGTLGEQPVSMELETIRGALPRVLLLTCRPCATKDDDGLLQVAVTDITSRRKAEAALLQSEAQLQATLRTAPDAIISIDGDRRVVFCNIAAQRLFGVSVKDITGRPITALIPDFMQEEALGAAVAPMNQDSPSTTPGTLRQHRARRVDGTTFPVEVAVSGYHSDTGALCTLVLRDITERKQAEAERHFLLHLREFIRLAGSADEMMANVVVSLGRFLQADRCCFALVDLEGDRFTVTHEHHLPELAPMGGSHPLSAFGPRVVEEVAAGSLIEVPDVRRDERTTDFAASYAAVGVRSVAAAPLMRDGQLAAGLVIGFVQPRTLGPGHLMLLASVAERAWLAMERLRLDAELRESEARYRTMAELVPVIIFTATADGENTYVNRRLSDYTGMPEEKLLGRGWASALHPDDRPAVVKAWRESVQTGASFAREFRLRAVDGSFRWHRSVADAVRDDQGNIKGWFGSCSDIHDLMRAQSALSAANELLEERVVERTAALATANKELHREYKERQRLEAEMMQISEKERRSLGQDLHDGVCQHLTGLAFLAEGIAHDIEKKGLTGEASQVEEVSQMVRDVAQQTRDVARGLHPVDVDANGLVEALRDLAARCAALGKTRCTLQCPAPAPVQDNEVAMHLYRIAQEAVTNAIKHARASRIVIRIGRRGEFLALSVTDNGRGLPGDYEQSNGLGLRLMRHRAQVVGGEFTVARRPHGGTVVKCELTPKSDRR